MLGFDKLREAISMIKNRKNFKYVSIEVIQTYQRLNSITSIELEQLKVKYKELEEKRDSTASFAATLLDENRELKTKIDELEDDNERWNMLDL